MKKLIIIAGLCSFLGIFAQESGQYSFSLDQAKQYAMENNQNVLNAKLDIEAAEKKIWETTAIGLPQINGNVSYQYIPGEIPSFSFLDSTEMPGLPPEQYESRPLAVKSTATYGFTLSQLVFSGEYIVGLQASRTYKQISVNNSEKTEQTTKENVSNAYFSILVLEENLHNVDSTISNMEVLLDQTMKMEAQGFMDNINVKQLKLSLNTIKNVRNTLDRQIDMAYLLLKLQLGVDNEVEVALTDNLDGIILKVNELDYDTSTFDLNQNIDFKILQVQEEVSELTLKRVKSTFLPQVSAFYQYQDKTEKASFDFTINNIIGMQVSVPIFSSGMKLAQVSQERIALEQTKNTIDAMSNSIEMQALESVNKYNNAIDKFVTEKMNIDISKEIYDDTEIKFKNGMASSMELTQANTQYLESYSNYITSIMELLSAKTSLDRIYNKL